jgi:alkylation response protein AidB-like acyl-CoA dehydrogenase
MSGADERADLRDAVASLLADQGPATTVAAVVESPGGYDRTLWRQLAEYGFLGLLIPEDLGGSGGQLADVAVLAEEIGRVLLPGPYVSSAVTATTALVRAVRDGTGAACGRGAELVVRLGSGEQTAVLVDARGVASGLAVTGDRQRGYEVNGTAETVIGAEGAGTVLVGAGSGADTVLLLVSADSAEQAPVRLADSTRRAATVRFDRIEVPASDVLASGGAAVSALREARLTECAALAADSVGGARAALELATGYAKTRVQFGRPIGSFQAIKHKLANMYIAVESAAAIAEHAAAVLDLESDELRRDQVVTAAGSFCTASYRSVAGDSIQTHGGIGFTWEHLCHRYLKRAWLNQALLGGQRSLSARFAAGLFDSENGAAPASQYA